MRMRDCGLISYWYKKDSPDVHQCLGNDRKIKLDDGSALALPVLSGAFVILMVGLGIALLTFIGELCARFIRNRIQVL